MKAEKRLYNTRKTGSKDQKGCAVHFLSIPDFPVVRGQFHLGSRHHFHLGLCPGGKSGKAISKLALPLAVPHMERNPCTDGTGTPMEKPHVY